MSSEAEAPAAGEDGAAGAAGGKKKLLIVLGLVGVLAAGGAVAWWQGMLPFGKPADGEEAADAEHADGEGGAQEHAEAKGGHGEKAGTEAKSGHGEKPKAEAKGGHGEKAKGSGHGGGGGPVGSMKALEPFIANLSDQEGARYLKATFQLEFWGDEVPAEFEGRQAQIRDLVLTLLSSKTFDEVRTPDGKQVLREEIIARVNQSLSGDVVKNVFFTEFIVQ